MGLNNRDFYLIINSQLTGCGGSGGGPGEATGTTTVTGPPGPAGPAGTDNKFAAGIICSGTVSGVSGAAGTALNGLVVNYKAYVTTAGDLFAYANVQSGSIQIGATQFFSVKQVGAATGPVVFVDDFATPNGGYWTISTDRTTLIVTAVYTDNSLGVQSPVTMTFVSSACTTYTF